MIGINDMIFNKYEIGEDVVEGPIKVFYALSHIYSFYFCVHVSIDFSCSRGNFEIRN